MSQWSILQRRAKGIEGRLQSRIDQYSSIAQKLNSNYLYDEERGSLLSGGEASELSKEIEMDLNDLNECITAMKDYNLNLSSHPSSGSLNGANANNGTGTSVRMNDELIKRYHEIYYDFNSEYKNVSVS